MRQLISRLDSFISLLNHAFSPTGLFNTASLYSILEGSTTKPWKKQPRSLALKTDQAMILWARLFCRETWLFAGFVPYDHVIWKHHTTSFWCMTKAFKWWYGGISGSFQDHHFWAVPWQQGHMTEFYVYICLVMWSKERDQMPSHNVISSTTMAVIR